MKLLCIEDNTSNLYVVQRIAISRRYELLVAGNGAAGLALARQGPDLILMDISLPDMDGWTLTRQIRLFLPTTPIIAVTAHALTGDAEKCLAAGCTRYLSKPYKIVQLLELLQEYETN